MKLERVLRFIFNKKEIKMTKNELITYLINQGYNEFLIKKLSNRELRNIFILEMSFQYGIFE